ncbi:protein transport protein S31 [Steccherinum ochraceum]|uniref:Protein transport protein SEC31 n=1 Tax=Steccherinum ochraceum TaxID=92696 RepID=A0A4R0RUY0_9APHY|nr:protein transport protein S31 [Steccherinum ochraceum]
MKLKEIHRTSTFAWSPLPSLPLLATGTVAGALDESFSNNGQLEIWAPDFLNKDEYDLGEEGQTAAKASITTSSRFNRLAWGYTDGGRDLGVLVAGMENGELDIWDPSKIVASADPTESLILRTQNHTGPVRGLDFNPIQTNLLASGAVNGEIYIWDLKSPGKPYTPGTRSTKLDDISALAWNHHVQSALAASSSTGYTIVWDLRGKREVAALAYGGGAGTLAGGAGFGAPGLAAGGRRGMSDVAWHPDNATRLVTSSEDDTSPIIMVWDLRNARAPEKILTGHEKGVLSLSWCKQDADLLLSCGKDNRALCWNPQTSEIIGELPSADNWAFQVDWCPRNPDLFATGFFDGTIGIHSIQSTNDAKIQPASSQPTDFDVFSAPGFTRSSQATLSLSQPPKWLRRPTTASFGYGGKLVSVSNLPSAQGKHQSAVVHMRSVVTEQTIVDRAKKLQSAMDSESLSTLAEEKSQGTGPSTAPAESSESWKALLSLFKANSRDELITLLGFSKAEIASRVAEAVANLKLSAETAKTEETTRTSLIEQDVTETKAPHEPVVSFVEPEREATPEDDDDDDDETMEGSGILAETTPSEVSASVASDATHQADGESTTTAPSLFGDEVAGTPQTDAAADFFGSIGSARTAEDDQLVPHTNYPVDSSVAATMGSRASSVVSESLKDNTFRIYPTDESETDRLVTKALVLGDFESAVSLCLSCERFADAILLAARGGPELLQRTQKAYFERRTTQLPYLRLFQSIVTNDLADIVQNADLQEWQEIFVVLCTFAGQEEFAGLAEQLGQRLEFQASVAKASGSIEQAADFRKNATLTYLAAGKLERLVNIWIEELAEEEKVLLAAEEQPHASHYTAHALALQNFVEKVTVFRSAISYNDSDLTQHNSAEEAEVRTYKLSGLYERYFEYADLLAAQGLLKEAVVFLKLTPSEYHGSPGSLLDFADGRARLVTAAGINNLPARSTSLQSTGPAVPVKAPPAPVQASYGGYNSYQQPMQPIQPTQPTAASRVPPGPSPYESYNGQTSNANNPYAPPPGASVPSQVYQHAAPTMYPSQYPGPAQAPPAPAPLGPPPKATTSHQTKRDIPGWNDAPSLAQRRTPGPQNPSKPAAITSPFPNSAPSPSIPGTPPFGQAPNAGQLPPPPRPGSVQQRPPAPPQGPPRAGAGGQMQPPHGMPPPQRMMSPPQGGLGMNMARPPLPPGQYAPPPQGQNQFGHPNQPPRGPGGMPPPGPPPQGGPYARGTPSPSMMRSPGEHPPPQGGMYAPPPSQHQQGPYGAPPAQHHQQGPPPTQHHQQGPPPPGPGAYGLPPQTQHAPPPGPSGQPQFAPPPPGPGRQQGPPGPPQGQGQAPAPTAPPKKTGPPPPKYPPGDRSHIPEKMTPVLNVVTAQLSSLKQITPPQQKRLVEDLERRINPLFDALNCETLSQYVCDQLLVLAQAMASHDRDAALAIHVELLTRGSMTDDIGLWMSGLKQLIMRLFTNLSGSHFPYRLSSFVK